MFTTCRLTKTKFSEWYKDIFLQLSTRRGKNVVHKAVAVSNCSQFVDSFWNRPILKAFKLNKFKKTSSDRKTFEIPEFTPTHICLQTGYIQGCSANKGVVTPQTNSHLTAPNSF